MADTQAATGLTVEQWDAKFFKEWIQQNRFARYAGTGEANLIQVKENLMKKKGDKLNFALVNRLTNDAVTGTNTLEGNEEDMASRSHQLTVDKRRNGVRVAEMEEQRSAIPLRNAAKSVLMDWAMEDYRDLVIQALGSINGVAYGTASEAQKDAWLVDNADRVLFGAAKSNDSGPGDHSAGLANIDNTNDKCTAVAISLMKRIAQTASPKIRPVRTSGDEEWFVGFAHPLVFRDLKNDATITAAQREVGIKMQNNRLFNGGDIVWDGMIIREIVDIATISSTIDVGPLYLCGAQAVGAGYAKRWKSVTEEFDYGDKHGVATEQIYGVEKLEFGTAAGSDTGDKKDHGVVTGYFAAVADA